MNHYDNTTETITHLSLCSGYEGIGLGLRSVLPNLREIAYVEREGFAAANLVAKMEAGELDAAPVFTDVKTFPYRKFRGCVGILSSGFPCQPFSNAGDRKGVEDPRHLFPYIANGIRECQPRIVFFENVEGIISSKTADGESVLKYVLRTLEGLGYRATAGIFSAEEVGAPHQRKRVFILGYFDSQRCEGERLRRDEGESEGSISGRASEELADRINEGSQRGIHGGQDAERQGFNGHVGCGCSSSHQGWTSRPGEPQHDWEEPRTIPQSKLGRASHGSFSRVDATANRVDRLRLLGNGVVPPTAAKAFVTLLKRLTS